MASLGQLRDRVTIQQPSETPDGQGGRAVTWGTLTTVWAAIRPWPRAGGEHMQANAVGAHQEYEVEVRYLASLTPQMRVTWTPYGGTAKTLQITEVLPKDGKRERMLLQCGEVV